MLRNNFLILYSISLLLTANVYSQTQTPPAEREEFKLNLNERGNHYLKFTFLNQVWLRYNQSNPGSLVLGEPAPETVDFGLRRTRMQFFGQLTEHVFFYTQFGQNNFNFLSQNSGNRKLQAFFHDALGEYNIWKDTNRLKIGVGLTITNGLSRFSQPSIGTIMTMDVPVFAQATVDQTDEFSRKLSVYVRGQAGRLDYRLIISDPFPVTTNGQPPIPPNRNSSFAQLGHHKQYQGFFIINFLDQEPHTTPYMTGTYLGKKKVFNLEGGFITQKKATWSRENIDTLYHNMNLWSAALYYDASVNPAKGTAISLYAGYFNYDFGKGYLRYNGIMNPASGITSGYPGGSQGNAFPMFGTGNVMYAQAGYLFKKNFLGKEKGTLMPYASLMSARYDRVTATMNVYDIGINWLISGHRSKISFDYQHRPYYLEQGNDLIRQGSRSQFVIQYQIYI